MVEKVLAKIQRRSESRKRHERVAREKGDRTVQPPHVLVMQQFRGSAVLVTAFTRLAWQPPESQGVHQLFRYPEPSHNPALQLILGKYTDEC